MRVQKEQDYFQKGKWHVDELGDGGTRRKEMLS